jgi:hypothetical protein
MFRITIRDVIWLLAMVLLSFAWFVDHCLLMNHLKSCRFALEHQRQTIDELSRRPAAP